MVDKNRLSFTAASGVFPLKIVIDTELVKSMSKDKKILPIHLQMNITNRCNNDCPWCSCSARNKQIEMPYEDVIKMIDKFHKLGCKCVTSTGGGEPMMHPKINDIYKHIYSLGIKIGMVSNGWLLNKLETDVIKEIVWMRISLGDERDKEKNTPEYWQILERNIRRAPEIAWSFSYVLTEKPDFELIEKMIKFANEHNFAHIRLVNDIFIADQLYGVMNQIRLWAKKNDIDDNLVIYQDRAEWTKGREKCLISLLKPVVDPEGYVLPCCGVQYAMEDPARDYDERMRMGTVDDLDEIYEKQKHFDGSKCVKCFYQHYNELLSFILSEVMHKEFM